MNNSTRLIIAKLLETKRQAIKDYRISRVHPDHNNRWNNSYLKILESEHDNFIREINDQIKDMSDNK